MSYINKEGIIVGAKEAIRLDANHDLYKDESTGALLIVKRFYIYGEDINTPATRKYMIYDLNGKLIEGNMFTDEAQTKLKRCTVSAKVLKSVEYYKGRY